MPGPDEALDLGEVVDALKPYLKRMVQTIGEAGSATEDEEGKVTPGDIRAASIGIELVTKYLSGRGADRASRVAALLAQIRASEQSEEGPAPDESVPA